MTGDAFLTEADVSDRLKVPSRTLQRWRGTGDGPPFVRLGPRRVAYRLSDVERWAASRTFASRAAELAHRALANIEFLDADGGLVARIDDYECVIDASLGQAFRHNRLESVAR